ncbi:class I SAM-dependent methyltransferase [Nostoc sp. PCC 7120 = FACHB-418]|nr:class I SAM-dependent methyltransferase [Anabaena cylindrica FACHB-318]MBD2267040.1 class I SAM-dependent methyltransferase [Anabaena sp. FACHB-709]MBD2276590.1 class I SAM-dependent methyltransferase [Nostoc sp. PCC 7120 = FACHB-418]MBD2287135.1 class I SAM-dependent methyltransferase [Anabaena cylindrica FACHB-170]MBD2352771.1 class I SAM-dependent methyltransferase [Trichormus variabilis FACHB-171]
MKKHMYRLGLFKALTLALLVLLSAFVPSVLANQSRKPANLDGTTTLQSILSSSHRSEENRQRDKYRHPTQTLSFFGLRPDMTVVELWPGSGWYTEILAPYLAAKGQLIVTNFAPNDSKIPTVVFQQKLATAFQQKLEANKEVFGKIRVALINPPQELTLAPDNSVDMVVTFRNIHNWVNAGYAEQVYAAAYKALKPGGILGVEEHRAKPGISLQESIKTGYMSEDGVIAAVEKVGFKLVGKSEINANPQDTKDYPGGVWALPPTLRQGQKDRQRLVAIGESDRMTLKFIKPEANINSGSNAK